MVAQRLAALALQVVLLCAFLVPTTLFTSLWPALDQAPRRLPSVVKTHQCFFPSSRIHTPATFGNGNSTDAVYSCVPSLRTNGLHNLSSQSVRRAALRGTTTRTAALALGFVQIIRVVQYAGHNTWLSNAAPLRRNVVQLIVRRL